MNAWQLGVLIVTWLAPPAVLYLLGVGRNGGRP